MFLCKTDDRGELKPFNIPAKRNFYCTSLHMHCTWSGGKFFIFHKGKMFAHTETMFPEKPYEMIFRDFLTVSVRLLTARSRTG